MTKDKILSAEEMIDAILLLAQSIFHQEYNGYSNKAAQKIFNFCKELKQQFHPPTMTEDELKKEAEELYPYSMSESVAYDLIQQAAREAHIKARKMGAIKMDRETAEMIWDAGYDYRTSLLPEVIKDFGENSATDKETFLKSIN